MFARLTSGLLTDVGLFLMRSVVGAVFVFHGAQKLFGVWGGPGLTGFATLLESLGIPYPAHAAVSASSTEFLGINGKAFFKFVILPNFISSFGCGASR